jgi:Rv2632c-like
VRIGCAAHWPDQLDDEVSDMHAKKQWTIAIEIDEHDGRTRAVARMQAGAAELKGVGLARLAPEDRDVPEIGDELATARALSELSHHLLDAAAADIERVTHQPAHVHI